jgi:hypothetical protein
MDNRGLRSSLSPEEKLAATGGRGESGATKLQDAHVQRLKRLSLIEERQGRLELSETGLHRHGGPQRKSA